MNPAGCDQCGREPARQWPDTISVYGDDMAAPKAPRIVPCSTLARWWLAIKRWF
jgi:hypothetical protein